MKSDKPGVLSREVAKQLAFERLAPPRVEKAIHAIRVVGNLSNRTNYSYDEAQAQAIVAALTDEIRKLQASFRQDSDQKKKSFELPPRTSK